MLVCKSHDDVDFLAHATSDTDWTALRLSIRTESLMSALGASDMALDYPLPTVLNVIWRNKLTVAETLQAKKRLRPTVIVLS